MTIRYRAAILAFLLTGWCSLSRQTFQSLAITIPVPARTELDSLIAMALERAAIRNKDVPDYQLLKKTPHIILLNRTSLTGADTTTHLLSATSLPPARDPGFILLSLEQIHQLAYDQHEFVYLAVNEVAIRPDHATVTVSTEWAIGKRKGLAILSGGWYELQYIRTSQGWQFSKVLQKWIS